MENNLFYTLISKGVQREMQTEEFYQRFAKILTLEKDEAVKEAYVRGYECGVEVMDVILDDLKVGENYMKVTEYEKKLITALRKLSDASLAYYALLKDDCLDAIINLDYIK